MTFHNRICVIIPAHNEEKVIASAISSIVAAGVPANDVFVADDYSSDKTAEISRNLGVNVIPSAVNIGKARMIELATKLVCSRYELVSVLDADTTVDTEYFRHTVACFDQNDKVAAVCGQPRSVKHNCWTAYRALDYAFYHTIFKKGQNNMGAITIVTGCAATFRSQIFRQIEFHPNDIIIEDIDITTQIHLKKLGRIVYEEKAVVYTQDPATLKDFYHQVSRWTTAIWQNIFFYRLHPFKKEQSWISWYWNISLTEPAIFSLLIMSMPLFILLGFWRIVTWTLIAMLTDLLLTDVLVAFVYGIAFRRPDVILSIPTYIIPKTINSYAFFESFVRTLKNRKTSGVWLSPGRY